MSTHTFVFDFAGESPLEAVTSFFGAKAIKGFEIIAKHEWPEIKLELSTENALSKFASFYLNKPISELTESDLLEAKYFEA